MPDLQAVVRRAFAVCLSACVAASAAACHDAPFGVAQTPDITTPSDFSAVVTRNTHAEGFSPAGWISQYELWVAVPPSDTANAGVVVAAARPVFLTVGDRLIRATPADIRPGDAIEVWREPSVVYGSSQAPPGAPAYEARQVVIRRGR